MAKSTKITAPVEGFKGKVAGVEFVDGEGETSDKNAIAYFRRKGYGIGSQAPRGKAVDAEPADPRKVSAQRRGTPVRDAAVNPKRRDFLPPTNAGKKNPHGPDVVAPGIHANQGVRPVKGGDVHVDDPKAQNAAETEHTEASTDGTPVPGLEVPEGDLDTRLAWVAEGESKEERTARANAVYAHAQEAGDTDDLEALGGQLTAAVYGEPETEQEPEVELKGEALDKALEERGLSKSGTADEKRARVAEHDAQSKGQD